MDKNLTREELWELYQAGRLSIKEYPCAVGDPVYRIYVQGTYERIRGGGISKVNSCLGISANFDFIKMRMHKHLGNFEFHVSEVKCTKSDRDMLGKYVFVVKEDAERLVQELLAFQESCISVRVS